MWRSMGLDIIGRSGFGYEFNAIESMRTGQRNPALNAFEYLLHVSRLHALLRMCCERRFIVAYIKQSLHYDSRRSSVVVRPV